ncbi:MAG: hypothetical protein HOV81_12265 [Kofleriaceae bacterium]|nr:hypothetical protein [Kofleriaceae bacterium]
MRKVVGVVVLGLVAVACVPKKYAVPKPSAPTARPFESGPSVALVDAVQDGPMYRVQIQADITRDVMPTDDLAIVVSVDDHEVGRYPIVGKFERGPTRIKQEIELPLGDYEIDYQYQGVKFAGMPFRLAQVPVWGGHVGLQLRAHPGTRVSLREKKLWVGRWWANDGPPQAWIVEWVRDGQVMTTTSGREEVGIPPRAQGLVGGAYATFRDERVVPNTIWTYGEEYPLPDVVVQTPGAWAARVVHGGSAPVAVVFTVQPGGNLLELANRNIASAGWQPSWSKRLDALSLSVTEVDRITEKMPHISSTQPFDDGDGRTDAPEPAIRVSTAAVRALFRSKELAEAWHDYLALNTNTLYAQPAALSKTAKKSEAPGAKQEAARRTKLRQLRSQIEQLIKTNGGPWRPDEHPHS